MLRQVLRPAVRTVSKRGSRAYHADPNYKPATMDDLPVPQGSWQDAYNAKQKKYNLQLAIGLAYTAATFAYIVNTGAIYLNWAPPVPKDQK